MYDKEILLANLVKLFRNSSFFETQGYQEPFDFRIKNDQDLELIITLDENFKSMVISKSIDGTPEGKKVLCKKSDIPKKLKVGDYLVIYFEGISEIGIFDTLNEFIKDDIKNIKYETALIKNPCFIKDKNLTSYEYFNKDKTCLILDNYLLARQLLQQLLYMDHYNVTGKLVYFSKVICEISYSLDSDSRLSLFLDILSKLNDNNIKAIKDFINWISDDKSGTHNDEKKSILACELPHLLKTKNPHFNDVLQNIQEINLVARNSYSLYLENFSYDKFVKELENNTVKFVTRINETISKNIIPVSFLSLVTFLFNIWQNSGSLTQGYIVLLNIILFVVSLIAFFDLRQKSLMLKYIDHEVKKYDGKGKIPDTVKSQWNEDRKYILQQIKNQKILRWLLFIIVGLILMYSFITILVKLGLLIITINF